MKASLQDWIKYLSRYGLKTNTIKKYHSKYRGDFKVLFELINKNREKENREKNYLRNYKFRNYERYLRASTMSIEDIIKNSDYKSEKKGRIILDIEVSKAEKYIIDNVSLYIREAELKDFDALIEIIRTYKAQHSKIKRLKDKLCGKTFYEKTENAKEILNKAQQLLKIMDSDIVLPPFNENLYDSDLENETKEKASALNIKFDTTHTLDKLLEEISKI